MKLMMDKKWNAYESSIEHNIFTKILETINEKPETKETLFHLLSILDATSLTFCLTERAGQT